MRKKQTPGGHPPDPALPPPDTAPSSATPSDMPPGGTSRTELRRRAEARLAGQSADPGGDQGAPGGVLGNGVPADDIDIRRILHEMDVHNIERDMQLDELLGHWDEAGKALLAQREGHSSFHTQRALQELRRAELKAQIEEMQQSRREIEAEMRRYVHLYDFAPTGYLTLDREGVVRQANLAAAALLGPSRAELLRRGLDSLLVGGDRPIFTAFLARVFESGDAERCEVGLRPVGARSPRFARLDAFVDPTRQTCHVVLLDISEHRLAEAQLLLTARVFDHAAEGILVTGPDRRIVTVNAAFTAMTGYTAEEVIGQNPRILQSGRQDAAFYQAMWRHIEERGWWQGELWNRRKDGTVYLEWLNINCVRDPAGKVLNYVGIFTDITVVTASQRRMEFLATHDVLTGLPNRVTLLDRMEQLIALGGRIDARFAVLFVDLDNFKNVNDSLGHAAGDDLLKEVTRRLQEVMRTGDTVARFGGDEFVLLLPNAAPETVEATASRIAETIAVAIALDAKDMGQQVVHTSASIGISLYPEDGQDADTLLQNADLAMYQAKERGKRVYCFFSTGLRDAADERLGLEGALRVAIHAGEIHLHYQPQVDMKSGTVVGVEALARWRDPLRGEVPPTKFIPLAEKAGLIPPLWELLLAEACRQLVAWQAAGLAIPHLSINASPLQFRDHTLVDSLARAIHEHGLAPGLLMLEITEGALMADPQLALEVLKRIKDLGVAVSLDDFGTGYSSLSYLRRFPIDELKIDRSFIDEIDTNIDDRSIAECILAMARSLHLSVVAEGVETAAHHRTLVDLGCRIGQGYLFARPRPAAEVAAHYPLTL